MAMLNDTRGERAEAEIRSSGTQNYADSERASRVTGERAPTYATEARHYRDDYGMSMDDTQYGVAEQSRIAFENIMAEQTGLIGEYQGQVDAANLEIAEAYTTLEGEYAAAKATIDAARMGDMGDLSSQIPTWDEWASDQGVVNIISDGEYQYSYQLAGESVEQLATTIHEYNKNNDGDMDMTSADGGINIDVHGYGAELSEEMQHAEDMTKLAFETEVEKANNAIADAEAQATNAFNSAKDAAYADLDTQYYDQYGIIQEAEGDVMIAEENIIASQNQVDAAKSERQKTLNGIRKSYSNRLVNIEESIGKVVMRGAMARRNEGADDDGEANGQLEATELQPVDTDGGEA